MATDVLEAKADENAVEPPHSKGEHEAKNSICFLFAMVVVWASLFSTGAPCAVL